MSSQEMMFSKDGLSLRVAKTAMEVVADNMAITVLGKKEDKDVLYSYNLIARNGCVEYNKGKKTAPNV